MSCDDVSMLPIRLNYVGKRGPWIQMALRKPLGAQGNINNNKQNIVNNNNKAHNEYISAPTKTIIIAEATLLKLGY